MCEEERCVPREPVATSPRARPMKVVDGDMASRRDVILGTVGMAVAWAGSPPSVPTQVAPQTFGPLLATPIAMLL
jgi:hypothetical protein